MAPGSKNDGVKLKLNNSMFRDPPVKPVLPNIKMIKLNKLSPEELMIRKHNAFTSLTKRE
jgi:hypothetical protein